MRHTLKTVFAHRSDTRHVLDESLASGYSRADTARVGPTSIEDLDDEPALAAASKTRHAGQPSSWENFKDAVNHGWNRVSPDMDDASHAAVDAAGDDDLPAADDWEHRHAGNAPPTWDKVKAAVRHGWDRVRS